MTEKVPEGQLSLFGPDSWCGKTCLDHSHQVPQRGGTSKESSRKSSVSSSQTQPMFLYLQKENGQDQVLSWDTERMDALFPSVGEYMTGSFGEQPSTLMAECCFPAHRNGVNGSRLSQILEACPPQRYALSARACLGILNRSERRGKPLPPALREALLNQAQSLLRSGGGREIDSYGKRAGKGALIQTELSGTLGVSQDQTLIDLRSVAVSIDEKMGKTYVGEDVGNTLSARDYKQPQAVICLEGNGSRASHHGDGWSESETMYTLNATEYHSVYRKTGHPMSDDQGQGYEETQVADTLNAFDNTDARTPHLICDKQEPEYAVFDGSRRHNYQQFNDVSETVQAQYGTGGNNQPLVIEMTSTKNTIVKSGISPTLTARMGTGGNQVNAVCMDTFKFDVSKNKTGTLRASIYKEPPVVTAVDCRNGTENSEVNGTLQSKKEGWNLNASNVCRVSNVVRRLTPVECERLQGYPDNWTDIGAWTDTKGKLHKESSDSARYKALGNSLCLPYWFWVLRRISATYERPATMGSLFDGIGGFPLCWERCNGKGTAVWASEIEEFPIAVTKKHFPEEE